jgi:uncharacterized protein (TIGR00251 family)
LAFPNSKQALIFPDLGDGLPFAQARCRKASGFFTPQRMTLPSKTYLRLEKTGAVVVDIHVIPNAARTHADGEHDGALRVRLHAPPVDGKANMALSAWLAEALGIAKRDVELIRGQTSKRKQLRVSAAVCGKANWSVLAG